MIKKLLQSQEDIEQLLKNDSAQTNWSQEIDWFNKQLKHLQHERLIHLIVTLAVGIASIISFSTTLFHPIVPIFFLDFILISLFTAYIFHYRKLENTTQYWYSILKKIKKKSSPNT